MKRKNFNFLSRTIMGLVVGAAAWGFSGFTADNGKDLVTFYKINGQWQEGPTSGYECKSLTGICSAEFEAGSNPDPDETGTNQQTGSYLPI